MNNKLVTLAIHTLDKANILRDILISNGIETQLERVDTDGQEHTIHEGYYIKVKDSDIPKALVIIENINPFGYKNKENYKKDDGRKRILVAVDFSAYSIKACQIAFNIAKENNAKVKILHVYHNIYFPSHIPFADKLKETPEDGLLDKTRKQMLELCMDIDKKISDGQWPSVNYSYSLREGIVDEEIESFVKEYDPALLILGTKGKGNNPSFILGNVAADVIEMVNIPVLAVPENSPISTFDTIKHIAFLTNLQKRDIESFNMLVRILGSRDNIKITLVHINRINFKGDKLTEDELIAMREHFREMYPQLNVEYKLLDSHDIPMAIKDYVEKENVNIITLNTRRRNILGRIFAPSISRKVLTSSDKAILVLRG